MTDFGTTTAGQPVQKLSLCAGDLSVDLLTLGAAIYSVRLKGVPYDLTVSAPDITGFADKFCYHGTLIAPNVNRLGHARAPLGDRTLTLEANAAGGHNLHSGSTGAHAQVWSLCDHSATHARLSIELPDGAGGFPGNRRLEALFEVQAPATLRMTVTATTDAETLINTANHSYWNLDGSAAFTGHSLRVAADHYLPTDDTALVTGELRATKGSAFDFLAPRPLAPQDPALDHCFCLSQTAQPLRDVLWLRGTSGVSMTLATTEAGVQIYDGRDAGYPALAIEAHAWPDAPNHANFAPISLAAGETRTQITEWRFARP